MALGSSPPTLPGDAYNGDTSPPLENDSTNKFVDPIKANAGAEFAQQDLEKIQTDSTLREGEVDHVRLS